MRMKDVQETKVFGDEEIRSGLEELENRIKLVRHLITEGYLRAERERL